jgi:hypothetical protein
MPAAPMDDDPDADAAPWAASVPGAGYEQAAAAAEAEDEPPMMAAVLLGQIIRFQKDRKHPDSLPLETVDVLARIVSGRVVEVVDRMLEDLLGD